MCKTPWSEKFLKLYFVAISGRIFQAVTQNFVFNTRGQIFMGFTFLAVVVLIGVRNLVLGLLLWSLGIII